MPCTDCAQNCVGPTVIQPPRFTRVPIGSPVASAWPTSSSRSSSPRLNGAVGRIGGRERILPIGIALLVLVASISSVAVTGTVNGATGSTSEPSATPRIAIDGVDPGTDSITAPDDMSNAVGATTNDGATDLGQYLPDGTLLKPIAVDTTVTDASARLVTYTVRSGDTLTGIAKHFGISMMTLWWANNLAAKDVLHIGQKLEIPPVDGLVIVVKAGDTLDSISALTGMSADRHRGLQQPDRPDPGRSARS